MIGDRQLARLVKFFTEAPSSKYTAEDISLTYGEARITYDPVAADLDGTGNVDRAMYAKLMLDSATLAAGTLVEDRAMVNESFNLYAMKSFVEGKLIAVARLIHAQRSRFTVEVRLLNEDGRPIASGYGSFSMGKPYENQADDADEESADAPDDPTEYVAYGSMWRTPFGYVHQN